MAPIKKTDSQIVWYYLLREWLIYLYFKLIKCNSEHSGTCSDFFIFHTSLQINLIGYKGNEVIFMYYVYIHKHKRTGEVMYCGKGSNSRYCNYNSRSDEHLKLMKQQQLEYTILKYFKEEQKAYIYEEKITQEYKQKNQCKFNISIGRKTSEETKVKLSQVLSGKKRTKETKERMKRNHARPLAKTVLMYKGDVLIKTFRSSREAGTYAVENGICSHGWCGRSLKTGEITKPTREFPIGGYRFVYQDDKIVVKERAMNYIDNPINSCSLM
ncbi:hypothetical protein [Bacillus cereus group sp. N21]|uniref:hypothetical protein n=1 Tax=Bacillus cereus group sp. N21 TaxID=2794591 RepID=UPI0018F387E2|nr:hypothetical protein [Bacillus cereus group sp. N21]MBJ8030245.1 hypothetical protein [Bacillus cereus group sp. N21]